MRSCYLVNAQELLTAITGDGSSSSKMSGLLVGCLVDISTGQLSFIANSKNTDIGFNVEPNTMLYPAVFVSPTCKECVQFEFGRIKVSCCYAAKFVYSFLTNEIFSILSHYRLLCSKIPEKAFNRCVHHV